MAEPTVEEVLKTPTGLVKEESKPSLFWVISALFFFPPWGMYLLWQRKSFHKAYAICSIILGILNFLTGISIYTSIYPAILYIYNQYGLTAPKESGLGFQVFLLTFFALLEVVTSYFLYERAKKQGFLETRWLIYLTIIFTINLLLPLYLILIILIGFFTNFYSSNQLNYPGLNP